MPHTLWPPNIQLSQWIANQFPNGYQGHAVDVGASDGMSISTTWLLERGMGWTVLCVEPNPLFHEMLSAERAFIERCACDATPGTAPFHIHTDHPEAFSALRVAKHPTQHAEKNAKWQTIEVRVETVDRLLEKWCFPKLDALCIDTEGTELEVLKGCDLRRWKPRVIVTECWDRVGPIDLWLESLGYTKTMRNVENDGWLRDAE